MPGTGCVSGFSGRRESDEVYFKFTSYTTPGTIYRWQAGPGHDPGAGGAAAPSLFRETSVRGLDLGGFADRQVFYSSKDGTRVPMTLVLPSIERHVFDVLDRASISYDVFVHSMFLRRVSNLRSGEKDVPLDPYDFIRLRPCVFEVKHQGVALEQSNLSTSGTDGQALRIQPWGDGLASIHNLLIALESQHALARLIARHARDLNVTYDAVAALRPDVAYVRDIDLPEALPTLMASASTPTVYTPDFGYGVMANGTFVRPYAQQSCCLSDRLAFGHVAPMLNVYMTRGDGWI